MYRIQLLAQGREVETYPVDSIDVAEVVLKAQDLLVDQHGADGWRIINEVGRIVRTSDDPPFR
jgi:hypothetical protein